MESILPARRARFETLEEWLAWFETLHPKKIDFSLDRIRRVLAALGIDHPEFTVVTVGGTNGKGSCVALLESIYLEAGYHVGAFTSPHLLRFNERIRVDGADATDAELIGLFDAIDTALGEVTLSYFETSAVAALLCFARRKVDVAILEVGMGGRLDAVNAVDADAALIVSVDLDHMEWLGPDREAIGREKAGIIRPDRPVIVADTGPPATVLAAIEACGARGRLVGRDYTVVADDQGLIYRDGAAELRLPRPPFGGSHQIGNAGAAVAVVRSLAHLRPVATSALVRGIERAAVRGRIEVTELEGRQWIFDVAHNEAAAAKLAAELALMPEARPTVAVFGAMRDKDLTAVLTPFVARVSRWHVAAVDSERTASAEDVAALLGRLGAADVEQHDDIAAATLAAAHAPAERVLVFGSFYTVGPAMAALGLYSESLSTREPKAWIQV